MIQAYTPCFVEIMKSFMYNYLWFTLSEIIEGRRDEIIGQSS